ncbi:MAG: hypothetical protein R2745_00705 [Vicinamibacterales bacterium]
MPLTSPPIALPPTHVKSAVGTTLQLVGLVLRSIPTRDAIGDPTYDALQ